MAVQHTGDAHRKWGRPIVVYENLVKCFGSFPAAALVAYLNYWTGKGKHAPWVYQRLPALRRELAVSEWELRAARSLLRKLGILEEELRDVPPMPYFKLDQAKLDEVVDAWLLKSSSEESSCDEESSETVLRNPQNQPCVVLKDIPKITKTEESFLRTPTPTPTLSSLSGGRIARMPPAKRAVSVPEDTGSVEADKDEGPLQLPEPDGASGTSPPNSSGGGPRSEKEAVGQASTHPAARKPVLTRVGTQWEGDLDLLVKTVVERYGMDAPKEYEQAIRFTLDELAEDRTASAVQDQGENQFVRLLNWFERRYEPSEPNKKKEVKYESLWCDWASYFVRKELRIPGFRDPDGKARMAEHIALRSICSRLSKDDAKLSEYLNWLKQKRDTLPGLLTALNYEHVTRFLQGR